MRIAIDIDNTIRDFTDQIDTYLEIDYPDKHEIFAAHKDAEYRALDMAFDSREEANKWMYDERVVEIFQMAKRMHPRIIDQLNQFYTTMKSQGNEVIVASVQRDRSIIATLWWLAKYGCKINNYMFFDSMQDKIDYGFDLYLDDCPKVLREVKNSIRVPHGYNELEEFTMPVLDIAGGKFNDIYEILNVERD